MKYETLERWQSGESMNNRQFAQENAEFRAACAAVGIPPGQRAASKWRNKKGIAWEHFCRNKNGNAAPSENLAVDNLAENNIRLGRS